MISEPLKKSLHVSIVVLIIVVTVLIAFQYKRFTSQTSLKNFKNTIRLSSEKTSTPINTPLNQRTALTTLLQSCEKQNVDSTYVFPNEYDNSSETVDTDIPTEYLHVLSIPSHTPTSKVLRVYFKPTCEEILLKMYHPDTKKSVFIGTIKQKTGGNSGGIFVPFAFSNNDSTILLDAWMGSPGAGGSSVDYGYAQIPVRAGDIQHPEITPTFVATRYAFFYKDNSMVLYTDEGKNTPSTIQPGPSNHAALISRDIQTGIKTTLLKEKNTSYQILHIDEQQKEARIEKTSYIFGNTCPEQDGNLDCANKVVTKITIPLP